MIQRAAFNDSVLQTITDTIVARFKPRRIVLFGSHARGDARRDSDYDLMVELEGLKNDREAWDAKWEIKGALPRGVEVDVTVRSPSKFEERRDDPGTLDWAIAREGVVIYPADADSQSLRPPARVSEGREPPKSIREWLEVADEDMRAVGRLSVEPVDWRPVCFHAQQAAEKYLKALLVHHRIHPPRTHNLTELLSEIRQACTTLPGLDADCALLSKFPVEPRYPSEEPKPDAITGPAAVEAMRRVVTAATAAMRRAE
jgi:HEPN domain-containing protein/predicted nucleotidyltransferase